MNKFISITIAVVLMAVAGCSEGSDKFSLTSPDITSGGKIGQTFAYTMCNGKNMSPALRWSHPPKGTKSYAIMLIDRNAMGWKHWIAYDIPAGVTSLERGQVPFAARQVKNSFGGVGYGGPCPPAGSSHTYRFQIWALDIANLASVHNFAANGNGEFLNSIGDHALDTASFDATYSR